MRLQPTAMYGIFVGTTRYYRTGPADWPWPHISNCYRGELSPYLLNAPVVTLSLDVLLIFIEPELAEDFRVFTQTCRIVNTRRFLGSLSPGNFFPHLLAHGAPTEKNMRLQLTAMFGIFIGTTRCYRTGPAGWPCPHILNCYHGELSPYLLNAPVVTLSLAVLLIFIESEPAEDFRVFTQTSRIVNTRRFLDSLSPGNFFPHLLAHGAPSGIAIFA